MSRAYLLRVAGDFGTTTTFNLEESGGAASNLTGFASVNLQARIEGDIPGVDPLRLDVATVIDVDPTTGKVSYAWVSGDLIVAGLYFVQAAGIKSAPPAKELTWDVAIIYVGEQHG